MSIWDKVKDGIDKAGKAAQDAIDDGKTRIEAYRAREQADKAAEAFGYAVFRAADLGKEIEPDSKERLMQSLREYDREARRLETKLADENSAKPDAPPSPPDAASAPAEPVPPAPAPEASAAPPGQV
ncbi:MAG: hypothetical protein ABJB74_08600 [Gemmatimonas sp.]